MRKEEFLTALRAGLTGLLPEGVEKLVEFCSEMIDDRMEDGLTEEEAVAAAGSLDELIQQAKTELLPVKTANFPEKTTFGDTLRTYTAESSICGIIANCDYTADFKLLPSENGTCRVECMESEKICYSVTTENNVLHIECADRRTLFSRYKFSKAQRHATVRVYLPQGTYKSLEVETTSGDIAVPAGYTFDTASLHSASGDIACCAECGALSAQAASGDITLKDTSCGTLALGTASGAVTLLNIKNESGGSIETASGKTQITNYKGNALEIGTASGKVSLENAECAALHINTASGGVDLTHTVSADVMEIGTASGSIHFENCDAASLSLDSMSGSVVGTLNTGKAFRAQSRSGKVDVPFDTGTGTCKVSTLSGSIRVKIAE